MEWGDGTVYSVGIQEERMEQVHKCKYLRCIVYNRGTKKVECENKVTNGRRVAVSIKELVNERRLSLQ